MLGSTKTIHIYIFAVLCTGMLLSSCATVKDFSNYVQCYKARYQLNHPYTQHAVNRGKYLLHAREYGSNHPGTPIILMHGFPDSLHLYDRLAPQLAKQHSKVRCLS